MDKLQRIKELIVRDLKNTNHYADKDFNPYELSGGNFDDAFYAGTEQGAGDLARAIQEILDDE